MGRNVIAPTLAVPGRAWIRGISSSKKATFGDGRLPGYGYFHLGMLSLSLLMYLPPIIAWRLPRRKAQNIRAFEAERKSVINPRVFVPEPPR